MKGEFFCQSFIAAWLEISRLLRNRHRRKDREGCLLAVLHHIDPEDGNKAAFRNAGFATPP